MTITITLSSECLHNLDLSPVATAIAQQAMPAVLTSLSASQEQLRFNIDYPREPDDPRELSEIPEVRLWFIRLDARYPWLPLLLVGQPDELARYTAMLVPHQFNRKEGIQFNPEALEIFVMQKIFVLMDWMRDQGLDRRSSVKSMAQMLGYEVDDSLFDLV